MFGGTKSGMRASRAIISAALLTGSALAGFASPVWAQSAETSGQRSFNIPAQPLADAIMAYGAQSGIQVTASADLVAGRTSSAISGTFSPAEALSHLLTGTGLTFRFIRPNVVTLEPAPQAADGAIQLGPVRVEGDTGNGAAFATSSRDPLSTEGTKSYAARGASIARGDKSLKDIPQSVTVVTRQRMDDQNLDTFDQVIMQTPSVHRIFVNSGQSGYRIRGFQKSAGGLVDGVQTYASFDAILGQAPDMATIDRVEVLRGATGLQFAAGNPGGVVNLVRKRPLSESRIGIVARGGSWDYMRGEVDVTGPLNAAGTVRGRVVGVYEDRGYFYDRAKSEASTIYGIIEADLSEDTLFTIGYRRQRYDVDGVYLFQGLPVASDGSNLNLPRSLSVGPNWSSYGSNSDELFAELKHQINADWTAKLSLDGQSGMISEIYASRCNFLVDPVTLAQPSTCTRPVIGYSSRYDFSRRSVDLVMEGGVDLLGRHHQLRLGATHNRDVRQDYLASVTFTGQYFSLADPWMTAIGTPNFSTPAHTGKVEFKTYSLYADAVIELAERLRLTTGARLNWYAQNNYSAAGVRTYSNRQDHRLTPFAGLVFDLTRNLSLYASYSDIFSPQATYTKTSGAALEPAIGANYEVGIKGEFADGRLTASAALFQIDQTGLAEIDADYPSGGCPGSVSSGLCYVNGGKVRSKGFELELNGEIARGLQASAGYAYTDAYYVRDRDANGNPTSKEGGPYGVVPHHSFRAYLTYNLPGAASDWTVGAGVSAQTKTAGLDYQSIMRRQSGRSVWDGQITYRISDNNSISVNVKNAFDKKYFSDEYGYRYGEPRNVMVTLRSKL